MRKDLMLLKNLKYITVTLLFKIAKSMWVIFNCPFLVDKKDGNER